MVMKRNLPVESAKSTVRATVSRALASALINGIDNAREDGRPLSQIQQISLAAMSIMAYDEALKACEGLEVEVKILEELDARRTQSQPS